MKNNPSRKRPHRPGNIEILEAKISKMPLQNGIPLN